MKLLVTMAAIVLAVTIMPMVQANHGGGHDVGGFSLPVGSSAGAAMWGMQRQWFLQNNDPTVLGYRGPNGERAKVAEPVVIEEGVLPTKTKIQGLLTTPDGKIIISP